MPWPFSHHLPVETSIAFSGYAFSRIWLRIPGRIVKSDKGSVWHPGNHATSAEPPGNVSDPDREDGDIVGLGAEELVLADAVRPDTFRGEEGKDESALFDCGFCCLIEWGAGRNVMLDIEPRVVALDAEPGGEALRVLSRVVSADQGILHVSIDGFYKWEILSGWLYVLVACNFLKTDTNGLLVESSFF